jgi:acyl carrier protein
MRFRRFLAADANGQVRARLTALLEEHDVQLHDASKETELIGSGRLDSLGLFKLAAFVEQEVGREIDIAEYDLAKEWNTIDDIVRFIAVQRAGG